MSIILTNEEKTAAIARLEEHASIVTSIASMMSYVGLAVAVSSYLFPMVGNRIIWGVALVFLLKSFFNAHAATKLETALQIEKSKE